MIYTLDQRLSVKRDSEKKNQRRHSNVNEYDIFGFLLFFSFFSSLFHGSLALSFKFEIEIAKRLGTLLLAAFG